MGKKVKTPKPPDPVATANAQAQYSKDTAAYNAALNRYDVNTPLGSLNWRQTGTDASGAPLYTQDVNLTPTAAQNLAQSQQNSLNLAQTEGNLIGATNASLSRPLDTSGLPGVQSGFSGGGPIAGGFGGGGPVASGFSTAGNMGFSGGQGMDTSGVPNLPTANNDYAHQVQDALYQQQKQYLDPQFQEARQQFDAEMQNKGIAPGSEPYTYAYRDFANAQQKAYSDARTQAITGGVGAMNTLFGMGLGAYNSAGNLAAQKAGIGNQAAAIQNQAATQQFQNELARAEFGNQAQAQRFGQGLQGAAFANQAQAQQFGQGLQRAGFNNAASGQALQQAMALYNQPLNTYNALMSGSQAQIPQFQGTPITQANAPDFQGAVGQNYQGQLNAYNAAQGGANSLTSGLFGLGAAALGAPNGTIPGLIKGIGGLFGGSDRRLKTDIRPVGKTAIDRHNLYSFRYIADPAHTHIGVMADEVEHVPGAVITGQDGYKMVNYSLIS